MTNEWTNPEHAKAYLTWAKDVSLRDAGDATLLSEVPNNANRVLDLGCGDGHLLALLLNHCPNATGIGLDFSSAMLEEARNRFSHDSRVTLVDHNMDDSLPDLGTFDCVVSSFAIHHCTDERKRDLYAEVFSALEPGGIFCNLEHVSSPNTRIHDRFLVELGISPGNEDPSNKLLDVETQLRWLQELGYEDVDCYWKWRELALLAGRKPTADAARTPDDIDSSPSAADMRYLDDQLEDYNRRCVDANDFQPLNLVLRDARGEIIAGLKADTGWDWLYVQILWIEDQHRKRGLGSKLLEAAETEAQRRGCIGACLASYTFQAPEFYRKRGYSSFGTIDDYPSGNTMYFFSKRFKS